MVLKKGNVERVAEGSAISELEAKGFEKVAKSRKGSKSTGKAEPGKAEAPEETETPEEQTESGEE